MLTYNIIIKTNDNINSANKKKQNNKKSIEDPLFAIKSNLDKLSKKKPKHQKKKVCNVILKLVRIRFNKSVFNLILCY